MNIKKNLLILAVLTAILASWLVASGSCVLAGALQDGFDYVDQGDLGISNTDVTDPRIMAVNIVRFFMTFLGIIAVVIILYGGFVWMTAAGNEDKVGKAKKIIVAGAIGLAVIISAYVTVNFVIQTTDSLIETGNIQY